MSVFGANRRQAVRDAAAQGKADAKAHAERLKHPAPPPGVKQRHIIPDPGDGDGFIAEGATSKDPTYSITCVKGTTELAVKSQNGTDMFTLTPGDVLQLTLKVEFTV